MFFLKSFVDKNIRSCCLRAVVSQASDTRYSTAVPSKRAISFILAFNPPRLITKYPLRFARYAERDSQQALHLAEDPREAYPFR